MWCVPELNSEYIERMENVLAIYEKPLDPREPVVCMDEKPVQLLAETREPLVGTRGGQVRKRDYEYERRGTANLYVAVEPKRGQFINRVTPNRKAPQFVRLLQRIERRYPGARTIHLVMDNLNIHCERSAIGVLGERRGRRLWRKFKVHHTPKHASWLNMAELGISLVSRQALGKDRFPNRRELRQRVTPWTARTNRIAKPIEWAFTRRDARRVFKYDLSKITRARH